MLKHAARGGGEGEWLRAVRQVAGRGRLGREWQEQSGNLYASTIVKLSSNDPPATLLAMVAGVAFAKTVGDYAGQEKIRLKWPNDVMSGPAKMGGILLERQGDAVVAGFGLNIRSAPQLAGRETAALVDIQPQGATRPDAAQLCEKLAKHFADVLRQWRGRSEDRTVHPINRNPVLDSWCTLAHPIGAMVSVKDGGGKQITGQFDGLDDDGAMRLMTANGSISIIRAGDVSVIGEQEE